MCSILGIFDLQAGDDLFTLRSAVLERSHRMRHRGPDWSGIHLDDGAILAHERLAIIDHGRMIALGTPGDLKASVPGGFLLRLRFGRHSEELLQRLQTLAGVTEVHPSSHANDDNSADVYADRGGSLVSEIANLASGASVELCDVHISEPSLENLFLHHTGRSLRD